MKKTIIALVLLSAAALLVLSLAALRSNRPVGAPPKAGVAWMWNDLPNGQRLAREQGKKVLLYFWASW